MNLQIVEPKLPGDPIDFGTPSVDKHADSGDATGQSGHNFLSKPKVDIPGTGVAKVEPDRVGTGTSRTQSVSNRRDATDFDAKHGIDLR
jgi:hypothetical protein